MFLFEPLFIITALLSGLIIFGPICATLGRNREVGATAGFFWGLFMGAIGLIIVLCSNKLTNEVYTQYESIPDQLKKYKDLLDSGAINEVEYNIQKGKLLNQ